MSLRQKASIENVRLILAGRKSFFESKREKNKGGSVSQLCCCNAGTSLEGEVCRVRIKEQL